MCKYEVTSRLKDFVPSTTLGPSLGTLSFSSHRLHLLLLPHIFWIFNIKCHSMQIYSHIECKGMITIMILKLLSFQKGSSISQGHIVLPLNICFLSLQYKYIHLSALKLLMTFFAKLSYICLFIKSFNNFLCYITVAE